MEEVCGLGKLLVPECEFCAIQVQPREELLEDLLSRERGSIVMLRSWDMRV